MVVGEAEEMKFMFERPRAADVRGNPWIEAYVRVRGLVKAATGVGMSEYAHMLNIPEIRRGRMMSGSRMSRDIRVERQTVPAMVVVAW